MKSSMKVLFAVLISLSLFVSCSKQEVKDEINDLKIKVSKEAGEALTKELDSAFTKANFPAELNCSAEAKHYGDKLTREMESFFKAEKDQSKASAVVSSICEIAVAQVLPLALGQLSFARPCLKTLGIETAISQASKLCARI